MSTTTTDQATSPQTTTAPPKKLPKGVVLGPDGKPCRSCTSFASWASLTKQQTKPPTTATFHTAQQTQPSIPLPSNCPPDVEELGRSSWTLLHSLTANYPPTAPPSTQFRTTSFLTLFSELYPCWSCASDFRSWMKTPGNEPKVGGRDEFGDWMCRAHNAVNVKLGKEEFDCRGWEGRWRTGVGRGAGEGCE